MMGEKALAAETLNTRYEVIETVPEADTLPFTVAKARDTAEGRIVTLQTLPARRTVGNLGQRGTFLTASQEAGRLDHPNIARLFDDGTGAEGDLYVASEYTRGITLKERIRRIAPFSLAVAADIAVAIAEALEYAHAAGVPHGDLRPHHVLLSPEGQIKVTDFAYCRAAILLTGTGLDPLYAAYAAPEVGSRAPGTAAADVYALGATLYEMLTGALPTQESDGPPSPRRLNPGVPPALEGIVMKALQPQPLARYRTAGALLADLRSVREALRTGRSLAWSPVAEKRVPRAPDPADTVVTDRPPAINPVTPRAAPRVGTAASDLDDDRDLGPGRAASRALSLIVAFLSVVAVCSIIGLVWYFSRFIAIPSDIQVPSLIGKTFDEAKQIAARDHFQLVERDPNTPHYSTKWSENQIYQQDPPADRTIKAGRDVEVLRSAGPPLLSVPDLTGMTQDRAASALTDANLPLGTVTTDYSDTVPSGIVISQQPAKMAMVARNTGVNFVVSRGPQPPDVPEAVDATPSDATTISLSWKPSARAKSYTVTRSQDGTAKTVAQGLTETHVTDSGLTPATTYTYSVSADDKGGSSGPSDPVTAVTPANVPAPTLPADVPGAPPAGPDDTGAGVDSPPSPPISPSDSGSPRLRSFTIEFPVPRHPRRSRRVQFEIQDALGLSWPYDEYREPGDDVKAPVQATGNRVTFRIFLDGKLMKQRTL